MAELSPYQGFLTKVLSISESAKLTSDAQQVASAPQPFSFFSFRLSAYERGEPSDKPPDFLPTLCIRPAAHRNLSFQLVIVDEQTYVPQIHHLPADNLHLV